MAAGGGCWSRSRDTASPGARISAWRRTGRRRSPIRSGRCSPIIGCSSCGWADGWGRISSAPAWTHSFACLRLGGEHPYLAGMHVTSDTLGLIGNTPLVRLKGPSEATGCDIFGKCEFANPGASVKDRAALFIVRDAEERGLIAPGGTIVEGTAG